jgi:hypothetical protein
MASESSAGIAFIKHPENRVRTYSEIGQYDSDVERGKRKAVSHFAGARSGIFTAALTLGEFGKPIIDQHSDQFCPPITASVLILQRLRLQPFSLLANLNINDFAKVCVRINLQATSELFPNSLFYSCP